MRELIRESIINSPIDKVFGFFSRPENLDLLTPPELQFKILTPLPLEIKEGALIDYTIKLGGLKFKWRTKIIKWNPPHSFTDIQLKGPYKTWIHLHTFEDLKDGRTKMTDEISFQPLGWIAEELVYRMFVKKKLAGIMDYRKSKLSEIFN